MSTKQELHLWHACPRLNALPVFPWMLIDSLLYLGPELYQ